MEKENIDPKLVLALMEREICRRALLMHLLMLGYEHFVSIDMLKRSMKTRKFTYEEAERLADTLERHMGIKVAPEKFIRDENEDANKLLDHYTELEQMCDKQLGDTMRPIHDGFNRGRFVGIEKRPRGAGIHRRGWGRDFPGKRLAAENVGVIYSNHPPYHQECK